jgi:hypothetical protein
MKTKTYTPWIIVNSKTGALATGEVFPRKYLAENYTKGYYSTPTKVVKANLTYKV